MFLFSEFNCLHKHIIFIILKSSQTNCLRPRVNKLLKKIYYFIHGGTQFVTSNKFASTFFIYTTLLEFVAFNIQYSILI